MRSRRVNLTTSGALSMASPPRPIPGLTRRRQTFFLTIVKPVDLRRDPSDSSDRYAFRATLGTRDESVARIKAMAIRADLETQWQAERQRRRPQPAIAATGALVDMLVAKYRAEVLEADDLNRVAGKPLEHLLFLPDELRTVEGGMFEAVEDVQTKIAAHAEVLQWCLAAGQLDPFLLILAHTLDGTGLPPIDWDAEPSLFIRFAQAVVRLYKDIAARAHGELIETPAPPAVPVVPVPVAKSAAPALDWATLLTDWLGAKKRKAAAIKITERSIAEFTKVCGPVAACDLNRGHAAQYRADLIAQGLRGRSIRNLLSPLVALLNLAVDSGKLPLNPWHGVKVDTSDSTKRLPWRLEQLRALMAVNNTRDDAGRWLLPLLLYTGCRLGEIAQLELADIRDIDGAYAIEVHDLVSEGHEARSVKTSAGLRVVPMAPQVLALGLREHVEAMRAAGERFLFPKFIQSGNKRPSELAGRYFLELRRAAGIAPDSRFSAHSCRHNVRSALAAAGVNETIIDKVIGHESGAVQSRYTHAAMPTLSAAVALLDWSELGWEWPRSPRA